jgi:hypothetical protein
LTALDELGLDLKALVAAGLDMVNASAHYFTTQQHDLAVDSQANRGCHALLRTLPHDLERRQGADRLRRLSLRRATREHLHTSAHLAYARGADGISLFNFAYYRQHGQGEGRGLFGEPPFEALKALRDPKYSPKNRSTGSSPTVGVLPARSRCPCRARLSLESPRSSISISAARR